MCVITWKVPDLSSMTWSCWLSSWNPGMPLANSTTSFTAGVKHWEKDSHISWLVRSGPDTGHALRGQALEKDNKGHKIINCSDKIFHRSVDISEYASCSYQHFSSWSWFPWAGGLIWGTSCIVKTVMMSRAAPLRCSIVRLIVIPVSWH